MLFLVKAVLVKGSFESAAGAPLRRSELLPSDLSWWDWQLCCRCGCSSCRWTDV